MATRSAALATGLIPANVTTTLFTVPAGQTWIGKAILLRNLNAASQDVYIQLRDPVTGAVVDVLHQLIASGASYSWEGWFVLGPADVLQAFVVGANVVYWISGTKLSGVAP